MKHFSAAILSNTPVSDSFHELTFAWDPSASVPRPGQFCTLRASPYSAPLLRRPFAFSGYDRARAIASIIYKRRGPATEILSALEKGEGLDVIGPLGKGFYDIPGFPKQALLCVAGGTGIGPMLFLAGTAASEDVRARLIVGCKTASNVPSLASLDALDPVITTDDGSRGFTGTPIDYLAKLTEDTFGGGAVVCACGPAPLLKGCYAWSQTRGFSCYVTIEQIMACGVGACMGCAVKVKDANASGQRFARACTEGPVFDSEGILWT